MARPAVIERDQLQAAAAEIAHGAIGTGYGGDHAQGRQVRFLRAGQLAHGHAATALDVLKEAGAVGGIARGRGGQHRELVHPHGAGDGDEAPEARHGLVDAFGGKAASGRQVPPQPAQGALVEQRQGHPAQMVVDHQAHGVGAKIDDPDPRRGPACGRPKTGALVGRHDQLLRSASFGAGRERLRALPRPDKLGLVMK